MIEKKPFVNYTLPEEKPKPKAPIPVKLNDREEEMVAIGRYAFNSDSKSGVLKYLAEMGLNVLLNQIGVDNMHRMSNPRRVKYEQEEPKYKHFTKK